MKKDITELYSFIDDFCQIYSGYEKKQLLPSNKQRNRLCSMSLSEIMMVMVMYHTSHAKNFKYFYKTCIEYIHKDDFPNALSYNRFVELMSRLFVPFNILLHMLFGEETGTYFIWMLLVSKSVTIKDAIGIKHLLDLPSKVSHLWAFFMDLNYI